MNKSKPILIYMAAVLLLWGSGQVAHALNAPHNTSKNIQCSSCHTKPGFNTLTSFELLCFNGAGCHNTDMSGLPGAGKKKLAATNASNRFKNLPRGSGYATYSTQKKQSSHGWKIPNVNLNAGATNWGVAQPWTVLTQKVYCSRCHIAHGETPNKSFLRASPDGDAICLNCHVYRNIQSVKADMRAAVDAGTKHYSHPVNVSFGAARGAKPDYFQSTTSVRSGALPTNYSESARVRLYTTADKTKSDAVICSSCHGPLHSADSNPYTLDNLSSFSRFGQISSSAGNLLRQYPLTRSNNMCLSCHKVQTHQNKMCGDCHEPHKRPKDNNIYLIRTSIYVTALGVKRSVQFRTTTEMADRWRNQGAPDGISNAICQVCHTTTPSHRNYSTPLAPRVNNKMGPEWHGGARYSNCVGCHNHTGGFPKGGAGCNNCHGAPDGSTPYPSEFAGHHEKHTGSPAVSYTWGDGTLIDNRNAGAYGFSCGRCHSPFARYTDSQHHDGTLKNWTADIGFKNKSILPINTSASYVYGNTGGKDFGRSAGSTWRYPSSGASDGQCRNVYCHGQFYNGYTSNNPLWNSSSGAGVQNCGACHGAKRNDPPGKTAGTYWGAHQRHVGNGTEQYNSGGWKFGCSACHWPTVMDTMTSIEDRSTHVDGRVQVEFNGGGYGNANSKYDGYVNYTSRKPKFSSPFSNSKPQYKACGLIYCHSDGSRMSNFSAPFNAGQGSTASARYPNWSSTRNFTSAGGTTTKRRCSRCHGNSTYHGITAAMPGVTSKGNSHDTHIKNGFLCNVCHDNTVNSNNNQIKSTSYHVNQAYDVKILPQYETSPGASNYAGGTCTEVNCHGGEPTPVWGVTATCQDCHMSNAGDVNKRINKGTKWQSWTGVAPKIYSSSWVESGHGRSLSNYPKSNNPAAAKYCTACHGAGEQRAGGLATKHGTGNNPFRLLTAPDRPNVVCNRCHGIGGSAIKRDILTHASSVTGGGHNYEIKCIDCHDPHGDNNIFMVHSTVPRPNDATSAKDYASGAYGITTTIGTAGGTVTRAAVDFVNNQYTTDYAKKTTANRICQQCHNETRNPDVPAETRYRYNGSTDHAHGSGRCVDCHAHTKGFKGAGCNACHGNPPDGTKSILGGLSTTTGRPASGAVNAGVHAKHVSVYGSGTATCAKCHQGGMYGSGTENTKIDIGFSAFGVYTGSGQNYGGQSGVQTGFYGYSGHPKGNGVQYDGSLRCNNMKCHGGGWLTKSFGTPTAPKWDAPNTATCGKCHGAKKAAGQGTWPTSKAHAKHAGTGNAGYDFECKLCHSLTVTSNYTTLDDSVHVNGLANVAFDTTNDQRVGSSTAYSGDTNINSGFGKCATIYCHSRGTVKTAPAFDYANFTANWDVNGTGKLGSYRKAAGTAAKCNYCHGNRSWSGVTSAMPGYPNNTPKANRHEKHVKTYGFMCVRCHNGVTANNTSISFAGTTSLHINRKYDLKFDSANYSDYGKTVTVNNTFAKYTLQTVSPYSKCKNTYCHSRGTDFSAPYETRTSFANFTARWGDSVGSYKNIRGAKAKCNYCHGNRAYAGTTSAMPNYSTVKAKANSHKAHVISNGLGCSICHYGVARNNTAISDATRHVNRFYNISIAPGYGDGAGLKRYSSVWGTAGGTCMNVTCHGSSKPKWGSSLGCRNCHFDKSDKDNYSNWSGFKGTAAQIFSSEFNQRGHGKPGIGKDCSNCHNGRNSIPAHGTATNPYRLYTSDANALCLDCHGSGTEKENWNIGGFGNTTGYKVHSKSGTGGDAAWNNYSGQTVKCIDCHDPHGDKNKKMVHALINYTGSDRYGRPVKGAATQMTFTTPVGNTNWSSFANTVAANSICRRCHSTDVNYMNKATYTGTHQSAHQPCTDCHKHKDYFKGGACDSCHGDNTRSAAKPAPPQGPQIKNWSSDLVADPSTQGLHIPHAYNTNRKAWSQGATPYVCVDCHGPDSTGRSETSHPAGIASNPSAGMANLTTSATPGGRKATFDKGALEGFKRSGVVDDKCSNVKCHTPRTYTRGWTKPTGCDGCHGYRKEKGSGRAFNLQTTQSHKIHINYTGTTNAPSWKKNYRFACSNCHYDWQTNQNYSTHYSGQVNITSNGPVNKVGGAIYARGRAFKGISSGAELTSVNTQCSKAYCHGGFTNGTAITKPSWKKGVTTVNCGSCHWAKTAANGWSDGSAMPERHPKHVGTAQYGFACARCHMRTVSNNTTVQFSYSSHVNGRKDVYFNVATTVDGSRKYTLNNTAAAFGGGNRYCKNSYCHSRGTDFTSPFGTRTSFSNFTAQWGDPNLATLGYKKARGAKAKCNYCHGNKAYSGTTSAMPNYSGNVGYVKAKANSHRVHVVSNGIECKVCHFGVAQNNTSISDRTRHVNAFYNISFAPGRRLSAGKMYSSVWGAGNSQGTGGGTCMRNTCHGLSYPKWGDTTTANCKSCHFTTDPAAREDDYGRKNGATARIYSSDWIKKGHGAMNRTCSNCHDSSVPHSQEAKNPFRLYTSDSTALCQACHGSATERGDSWNGGLPDATGANAINIVTHNKADATGGNAASWNNFQNNKVKCVDCHDPHGDKNRRMVQSFINHTGSDRFGRPTRADFSTISSAYSAQMTFTTFGGTAINWSSFANTNVNNSVCRRCHTPNAQDSGMGDASGGNMTKANYAGGSNHQATHQACTGCHKHSAGFKGGGESSGDLSCDGCHSTLFNPMNSGTNSYHHVMQNTSATAGATKYPTGNNINQTDSRRRCLMCHVDHNIFKDQTPAQGGRAGNLRANINTTPSAIGDGRRSDWSGTDSYGGLCLSCHTVAQTKNMSKQINDGSTKTLRLFTSMYRNTPHNYTAIGVIGTDSSRFKANCLKCHNDTMDKTKFVSATTTGFGLHDSKLRRINSKLGIKIDSGTAGTTAPDANTLTDTSKTWTASEWNGRVVTITTPGKVQTRIISANTTNSFDVSVNFNPSLAVGDTYTIGDPPEEDYCFNCHGASQNPNFASAKDYYGMVNFVNTKALKMEQTFTGDAGVADSGTVTTLTDTKSWQIDQWKGYLVKITAGTNAGKEATITANTATTLTVATAFKKAIDSTSGYAIGNPFRHRIDQFSGQHKSDEALTASGTATTTGWFADTGTSTHVGCSDCHNPHSQRKPGVTQGRSANNNAYSTTTTIYDGGLVGGTKNWATNELKGYVMVPVDRSQAGEERMIISNTANTFRVGAAFSARMTGVYYAILPKGRAAVATQNPYQLGNVLNGPNNGQWGVKVTKWDMPGPNTTTANFNNFSAPTFAKVTTLYSMKNKTYELCLKCHSKYGWGTSGTPFKAMDTGLSVMGVYTAGRTTDISAEINPNNLAHHALIEPGKNQPIKPNYGGTGGTSYYNVNWPKWNGTAGATIGITTAGAATLSEAMPTTVIPGWYVYVGADAPPASTAGSATTGWFQITEISSGTSFKVTPSPASAISGNTTFAISAGLGNNFVPPYGPWSVINCADCHDTDAANDPSGPHGSGRNWLLRKMENQTFPWFNGTNVITVSWTNVGWVSKYAANILCLNCHRADVYGADGNAPSSGTLPTTTDGGYQNFAFKANFARQNHTPESTVNAYAAPNGSTDGADGTTFRMVCLHCHAGNAMGAIHGTNLGASLNNTGGLLGTGFSYRGKRFLTGGSWNGLLRSTTATAGTCYTNGISTDENINVCNRAEAKAMTAVANYDYESGADY